MGYDYRLGGSQPGASAPLDGATAATKTWLVARSVRDAGVPVERTILGLPLYGVTWPVDGPGIGAAATGSGERGSRAGTCGVFEAPGFAPDLEPIESVEFYVEPSRSRRRTRSRAAAAATRGPPETTRGTRSTTTRRAA